MSGRLIVRRTEKLLKFRGQTVRAWGGVSLRDYPIPSSSFAIYRRRGIVRPSRAGRGRISLTREFALVQGFDIRFGGRLTMRIGFLPHSETKILSIRKYHAPGPNVCQGPECDLRAWDASAYDRPIESSLAIWGNIPMPWELGMEVAMAWGVYQLARGLLFACAVPFYGSVGEKSPCHGRLKNRQEFSPMPWALGALRGT